MHNTFNKALLAGLVSLTVSFSTHAQTLNDIYQKALQNDHQFKAAKAGYLAEKEESNIGLAGLLPRLNSSYTKSEGEFEETGQRLEFSETGITAVPVDREGDTESAGYTISLSQPLFDMGLWHTYQRGKLLKKAAEAEYEASKQQLIIRVAEAYLDVLRAVDNFETAKAEEAANAQQLEQTRKRFEVGLTAITEVHEAQASYDTSLARRLLQEGNVGIAFEALEVITGTPHDSISPLKDNFPISLPSPASREKWVEFAKKNNYTLSASFLRAQSAKQSAKVARAGHFPTVEFGAQLRDNDNINPISDTNNKDSGFSITATLPLFTGGETSARRRQAAQRYIEARENYLQAQRDTVQNARSNHLTVTIDVSTVKARKQAITSSSSALEATKAGYDVGTRDLVDVLVAQRALYTAQRDYSDALYTYILNTLRLKEIAGTLKEQDVLDLDVSLDASKSVSRYTE